MKKTDKKISLKIILTVFRKFHLTIFVVFFVVGLSVAVIMLTNIFNDSNSNTKDLSSTAQSSSSNQAIVNKILGQEKIPPYSIPAGRANPFSE